MMNHRGAKALRQEIRTTMTNMFAKLVSARLKDVRGWLYMASDEIHDEGTREWAIKNASEEMSKITDDFRVLKNETDSDVIGMVGKKVATEYHQIKERLEEYLNK